MSLHMDICLASAPLLACLHAGSSETTSMHVHTFTNIHLEHADHHDHKTQILPWHQILQKPSCNVCRVHSCVLKRERTKMAVAQKRQHTCTRPSLR